MQLEIDGLVKRYHAREAIRGVSLSLQAGVTAIVGVNGAGKSTLIRSLATVEKPSAGSLRIDNTDVTSSKRARQEYRRRLGWLPQTFSAPMSSTLRRYLEYVAWLKEVPRDQRSLAVDLALSGVELTDRTEERVGSLSGGMLRRAGLAQALVNNPSVLLLDEPTAGLDPRQRITFASLVKTMARDRITLLATHLMEDVVLTASNVVILDAGRVLFHGTLGDLCDCEPSEVSVERLAGRFAERISVGA